MQYTFAILSSVACPALQYFSTLSHKGFGKEVIAHKMCVLIFFTVLSEKVLVINRAEKKRSKIYICLYIKCSLFLSDFNKA
jgi:hypothetical protein